VALEGLAGTRQQRNTRRQARQDLNLRHRLSVGSAEWHGKLRQTAPALGLQPEPETVSFFIADQADTELSWARATSDQAYFDDRNGQIVKIRKVF
jgi:hypothetical protein